MLPVACGNRREPVCPACSAVYKRDARQLVRAGLTGGKGIPETVAAHPCVFATLTAPSFGPVHARRMRGRPCCPAAPAATPTPAAARTAGTSPAPPATATTIPGSASRCARTATTTPPPSCSTPTPGTCGAGSPPTCPASSPAAGVTQKQLRALVRIRYVKVAEYQARGVVHFHAIIRLDAPGDDYQPPPAGIDRRHAVRRHRPGRRRRPPHRPGRAGPAVRLDLRRAARHRRPAHPPRHDLPGTGQPLTAQAVANYIAKYATKTLTPPACPTSRSGTGLDIDALRCSAPLPADDHHRLAARQPTRRRPVTVPEWAHMLGYGGHFLTKSRRYSVTFGQLRQARTDHRRAQRHPDGEPTPGDGPSTTPSSWSSRPGPTPEPATPQRRR